MNYFITRLNEYKTSSPIHITFVEIELEQKIFRVSFEYFIVLLENREITWFKLYFVDNSQLSFDIYNTASGYQINSNALISNHNKMSYIVFSQNLMFAAFNRGIPITLPINSFSSLEKYAEKLKPLLKIWIYEK